MTRTRLFIGIGLVVCIARLSLSQTDNRYLEESSIKADQSCSNIHFTLNDLSGPVPDPLISDIKVSRGITGDMATDVSPDLYAAIDFRFAPLQWQSTICFTDYDSHKTLVGENGEFRYGHPEPNEIFQPTLLGMEQDRLVRQWLDAPGVPIIHTHLDRAQVEVELISFATNRPDEGRVDNVILKVTPKTLSSLVVGPALAFYSRRQANILDCPARDRIVVGEKNDQLLVASSRPFVTMFPNGRGWVFRIRPGEVTADKPLWCFLRLPCSGQGYEKIASGLQDPWGLLAEVRAHWKTWSPVEGAVTWRLPQPLQDFLTAGACSMFQMREKIDGRLTLQAGPTVYRGFWVLDGHWMMEAIRYLGFDSEAQRLLEDEWASQDSSGAFFAGAGREHWKDTGIAIFSLIRHAELAGDWTFFDTMKPGVLRAVKFLESQRAMAAKEGGSIGRYGLLAKGFCDGGIDGIRPELTNTVWVLAGLKALTDIVERRRLEGFDSAIRLYGDLRQSFLKAAEQERRRHTEGFYYLHMLLAEDPQWQAKEGWALPRPQSAQWALSHAIFPGLLFGPEHWITQGHNALMQSCVREQVPAETGWIQHGGLWNNQAAFQAQIHLWLREPDLARRNFLGFLNHAAPVYVWREEQPLRNSVSARQQGDMPHISATSEMVRYLRHMLALEVDTELRLLQGIGDLELSAGEPFQIVASPTRFGRVSLALAPESGGRLWRLRFERGRGPAPTSVELPLNLGTKCKLDSLQGAKFRIVNDRVLLAPNAAVWSAVWRQ